MADIKLPADLLTNPRERMADYIYEYAQKLRAYWSRHGVKDGKIYVTTSPHLPGARDELVGTIYGIDLMVERQPQTLTATVEVTQRDDGFNVQFGKATVHVKGGPVRDWAETLFE
jgi:hypothetical protein